MKKIFVFFFTLLVAENIRATTLFDNGTPDLRSGYEMTYWIDANQFTTSSSIVLTGITFWEVEASQDFQGIIVWEIYADDGTNNPGALLASGTSTNLTHFATGRIASPNFPEYIDTFNITPTTLSRGTYWLALHNGYMNYILHEDIFWETGINSNPLPSQSMFTPFLEWASNFSNSQLAFQVAGVYATRITAVSDTKSTAKVSFTTVTGENYRVEYKNNLTDAAWTIVSGASSIPGTGNVVQVSDSSAAGLPHRYYHVVIL